MNAGEKINILFGWLFLLWAFLTATANPTSALCWLIIAKLCFIHADIEGKK